MENPKIGQLHVKNEYMTKTASQIRENVYSISHSPILKDKIDSLQFPNIRKNSKWIKKPKYKKLNTTNIRSNHI